MVPQDRIALSQGTIRAAEEMGADQVPQASLYLQYAREQAQEAQTLFKKGRGRARYVAAEALGGRRPAGVGHHPRRARAQASRAAADKKLKDYQQANYQR